MAYSPKNFSVLAFANGFTLWHYTTKDQQADVNSCGYFNPASDNLRVGDMILANIEVDNASPKAGIFLVRSHGGNHVEMANLTDVSDE